MFPLLLFDLGEAYENFGLFLFRHQAVLRHPVIKWRDSQILLNDNPIVEYLNKMNTVLSYIAIAVDHL